MAPTPPLTDDEREGITLRKLRARVRTTEGAELQIGIAASLVGISESSFKNYEYGASEPQLKLSTMQRYCQLLGVGIDDLVLAWQNSVRLNQLNPQNPKFPKASEGEIQRRRRSVLQ